MNFRSDLALEQAQHLKKNLPDSVRMLTRKEGGVTITAVQITDEAAKQAMGKEIGSYITIALTPFYQGGVTDAEIEAVATELSLLLPREGTVLIAGLGNIHITPDALGPRTVDLILATRHIAGEVAKSSGLSGLRPVAAIAPGVLGQTGIETSEIISAIVARIKPAAVLAIDALCAKDCDRLGSTIQISNTGISPGSGVMNHRRELSFSTLGVPVVSMGVPTVVDAETLLEELSGERCQQSRTTRMMMVTPREVDLLIERASKVLSLSINKALQPDISLSDITYLVS